MAGSEIFRDWTFPFLYVSSEALGNRLLFELVLLEVFSSSSKVKAIKCIPLKTLKMAV